MKGDSSRVPPNLVTPSRVGWGVAAIFGCWFVAPFIVAEVVPFSDPKDLAAAAGQFGDRFGSINALFTGLAFFGVIVTALLQREASLLQREELELQRTELADTRAVLATQATQLERQSKAMEEQVRDANFFQALSMFRSYAANAHQPGFCDYANRGASFWQRLVAERIQREMPMTFVPDFKRPHVVPAFFEFFQPSLGPYFAQLQELLRLTGSCELGQQRTWARLLRAQLSAHELVFIFYRGLAQTGFDNVSFKRNVEHAGLLAYLPQSKDYPEWSYRQALYDDRAFHLD